MTAVHWCVLPQVRTLQQIQMQQQELLLSHAQMLSRWQDLHTRSSEFSAGFNVLTPGEVFAAVSSSLACGMNQIKSSSSSSRSEVPDTAAPQQQQQQQVASAAAAEGHVQRPRELGRLWRDSTPSSSNSSSSSSNSDFMSPGQQVAAPQQQQQQQQLVSAAQGVSRPSPTAAATTTVAGDVPVQQQQRCNRWHVSVRLWLPQWVPDVIEDLDYELTSQQYIQTLEAAAEAAMTTEEAVEVESQQRQQQACW
jgi:hypothetical protein